MKIELNQIKIRDLVDNYTDNDIEGVRVITVIWISAQSISESLFIKMHNVTLL